MSSSLAMRGLRFAGRWAAAAGAALFALTVGVTSRRHRRLVTTLARHAGYDDHPPRVLPQVAVDVITSSDTQVILPEPLGTEGNISLLELLVLSRMVQERAPKAIFEIGTFDGRTTLAMAANAPSDTLVYSLDLPARTPTALRLDPAELQLVDKPASGTRIRGPSGSRIRQLYGDSATFDFTPYTCDFVFVDASHARDYVINDSRRALAMLRDGRGMIVWHDYGEWEGVTQALNELSLEQEFRGLKHVEGTTLAILEVD